MQQKGKEVLHFVSNIVIPQVLHTIFDMAFTSLYFITYKYPSRYALIYPFTEIPFISIHYILYNFNIQAFPSAHHVNHFLTLFLKAFGLKRRVPKIPAGNWFQSRMAYSQRNISRYPSFLSCF